MSNTFTKYIFTLILTGVSCVPLMQAQEVDTFDEINTDYSLKDFYLSKYLQFYTDKEALEMEMLDTIPFSPSDIPDSVYIERLLNMRSSVNLRYNDKVRRYIEVYVFKRRRQMQVMLALSNYYFPIFEEALDQQGVPTDLKYLAIIESALNPYAKSRMGAAGLWQFMYRTGKMYDLNVDANIDERYDPTKASQAAAVYLKDLYTTFGDWSLAIAAYNCGPGNVHKAIRRAKGKTDFWQIYNYLPRETRGYVPAFVGASYAMQYYREHGIYPPEDLVPMITDTIMFNQNISMAQMASVLNVPPRVLRDLNPQYRNDIITANQNACAFKLPVDLLIPFIENKDTICALTNNLLLASTDKIQEERKTAQIVYVVKKGDNLAAIGQKFNVQVSQIREWNDLSNNLIHPTQKLVIYTKSTKYAPIAAELSKPISVLDANEGDPLAKTEAKNENVVEDSNVEELEREPAQPMMTSSHTKPLSSMNTVGSKPKVNPTTVSSTEVRPTTKTQTAQVDQLKTTQPAQSKQVAVDNKSTSSPSVAPKPKNNVQTVATNKAAAKPNTNKVALKSESGNMRSKVNTVQARNTASTNAKIIQHKVVKGETLFSIARKYQGSNIQEIIRLNNLQKSGNLIFSGQVLRIPVS